MNAWLQFLTQHGGRIVEDDCGQTVDFGQMPATGGLPRGFVAPLCDLGLIVANGDESATFLHNQLTNDVEHLGMNEARLAAYCSPKGRMLASLLMWRTHEGIVLQLPRQIQAAIQKRLQMFVLRAKVKLTDASDGYAILGLAGEPAAACLTQWFPSLPAAAFAKTDSPAGTLIRLPDAFGMPRFQWIAPAQLAEQAWPDIVKTLMPVRAGLWHLTEIHAGIPQITQPTQEHFVPQMVNFELIGGVNFKKGCYPGQEIVARSQYLGKLKRRMLLASVDQSEVKPGVEIFSSADPDQPCGMVVNAAHNLEGGSDCLVEVKIAVAEEGSIHLGSAQGPQLRIGALPYPLPA